MARPRALAQLQERLGFSPSATALLQEALTHRSYLNEHPEALAQSNERLEFFGDALLSFLVAQHLFERFPELDEGTMTHLRAALVRREALAAWALELGLGDALLLSQGEERTGGRKRPRNLAGALEAVLGALYFDRGLDWVRALVQHYLEGALQRLPQPELLKDAKSRLQERMAAERRPPPRYELVAEDGPPHARRYTVRVLLEGQPIAHGEGRSKRQAEMEAAAAALRLLEGGP